MNILITGGAGFIGSHLSEKLTAEGHKVTVLDSLSDFLYPKSVKEQNILEFESKGIAFIHANLLDTNLATLIQDTEIIINQAAIPGLEKSWSHLSEYVNSNVVGLGNLLQAAVNNGVQKFIQISTSSVYGLNATGAEDSEKMPYSPYGVTKLAAENLVKAYEANFGLDVTILRYFSVYGPRQRPDMAFHKFIKAVNSNEELFIYGDGSQSRTNTYIDDVVSATILSLQVESKSTEKIFNISGSESWKLIEVIQEIEKITGKKANIRYLQKRSGDQMVTIGNTERARQVLNWKPQTSFSIGLKRQVEWQLALHQNPST